MKSQRCRGQGKTYVMVLQANTISQLSNPPSGTSSTTIVGVLLIDLFSNADGVGMA